MLTSGYLLKFVTSNIKTITMKNSFFALALFFSVAVIHSARSQKPSGSLKETYDSYIALKNDLVKDAAAKASADNFVQKVKSVKTQDLSPEQQKIWTANASKILKDAELIRSTADIEKQRKAFSTLSENMYAVAKTIGDGEKIYYQFCPMKKSYWLSSESAIKNPYYGKSMLTCGSVKEVIQ
jgi:hypothetical protein